MKSLVSQWVRNRVARIFQWCAPAVALLLATVSASTNAEETACQYRVVSNAAVQRSVNARFDFVDGKISAVRLDSDFPSQGTGADSKCSLHLKRALMPTNWSDNGAVTIISLSHDQEMPTTLKIARLGQVKVINLVNIGEQGCGQGGEWPASIIWVNEHTQCQMMENED